MTEKECLDALQNMRWNGTPTCPYCDSTKCCSISNNRYHCNSCNTSFSVTVQTLFHQTRIPLSVWFQAISIIVSSTNYVSSRNLALQIGVNKHTGYRIIQKVNKAMFEPEQKELLHQINVLIKGGNS